jgi:cysteine desulfurase
LRCFEYLRIHEGCQVSYLPVNGYGQVAPDDVKALLRSDTVLVSVMRANNETGTLQPVREIGSYCRERGVWFHTDAAQSFGKESVEAISDFQADLVSLCGHKFHGPKGAGALYARSPLQLAPVMLGGSQENERRAGTENLAAILGLVRALELFVHPPVFDAKRLTALTRALQDAVMATDGVHFVSPPLRLPNTVAFTIDGCDSLSLLAALDLEGICASSGSACSAGSLEPSHVLLAQGYSRDVAGSFLRFSLGRGSTEGDIEVVREVFGRVVGRIRETSS